MSVNPVKSLVLLILRIYQYAISPLLGRNCRFYPSCSAYAKDAIETHGLLGGSFLSIKRLLRCHPWHPGGYDPVPDCSADGHDAVSEESRSPLSAYACATKTTPLTNSPGFRGGEDPSVDKTTASLKAQNQTDSMAR